MWLSEDFTYTYAYIHTYALITFLNLIFWARETSKNVNLMTTRYRNVWPNFISSFLMVVGWLKLKISLKLSFKISKQWLYCNNYCSEINSRRQIWWVFWKTHNFYNEVKNAMQIRQNLIRIFRNYMFQLIKLFAECQWNAQFEFEFSFEKRKLPRYFSFLRI